MLGPDSSVNVPRSTFSDVCRRTLIPVIAFLLGATALPFASPASAAPGRGAQKFPTVEAFVEQGYRDILGRQSDAPGLAYWSGLIKRGEQQPSAVLSFLIFSPEFNGQVAPITRLHLAVLGRLPSGDELRSGVTATRSGQSLGQFANGLLATSEFQSRNGGGNDNGVRALLKNTTGAVDPAAVNSALQRLATGTLSLGDVALELSESADHVSRTDPEVMTTTVFLGLLRRTPDPEGLQYWPAQLRGGLHLEVFVGAVIEGVEYQNRFQAAPAFGQSVVASGLNIPWDVAPLPDGSLLVTERAGRLVLATTSGTTSTVNADFSDLFATGETGLMGLALDPGFASNRRFYSCQGHASPREIQVIAWQLSPDSASATRVADPLVGGLPISSGRHGGCQLEFDTTGSLVVGTGDSAVGSHPQNLASLGGKVLRVNPQTGGPAAGNPFLGNGNPATELIYSYGHRNVQGVSIHPTTGQIWTVEHGPNRDDEINQIVAGGNYGWNPVPGYNENVPMTDRAEFPAAIPAMHSTGAPTLALSGAEFLSHPNWGSWQGGLAVASLKNRTLRVFFYSDLNQDLGQATVINRTYGRLRAVEQAADGNLYVTTSNGGGNDRVIRISP